MTFMSLASAALGGALLCAAGCATAARVLYPVSQNAHQAKPGDYVIDPAHTTVIFSVDHFGFSTFYGRFNDVSGRLALDVEQPEVSKTAVRISAASIDTPSDDLDEQLRGADMFDVVAHPEIFFESRSVRRTGEATAIIEGLLTIKGVTLPIELEAEFHGSGKSPLSGDRRAGFDATAKLSRRAYGLDAWNGFVSDEVRLVIAAEFRLP